MKSRIMFGRSMRAILMGGACLGALSWQAAQAQQSQTNDNGVEEVVVSGIRGSLQRNLDIKRDAEGLVDAISSTDIGKFPDADMAAAMSRIPGVTVSRGISNGGGTPTSTGDAAQITVRGFGPDYNETLFDGRQISTATGTRAFDFSVINADFVKQMSILKSPDASLSSGAIGATVNILFPKPFDHNGLQMSASLSESYSDTADVAPTPQGTFLVSDTFAHNTFGILADISYSDHRTQANHVNVQGWEGIPGFDGPGQLKSSQLAAGQSTANPNSWFIQDYGIYQEQSRERRMSGRLALQWAPSDKLLVTVDDNYSRDQLHTDQYGYSVWFNSGSLTNIQRDGNGTITNFIQPNTPTDFQSQINQKLVENNNTGINVKWDVLPKLQIEADADHAQSWLNPGGQFTARDMDVGYGPSSSNGTNGTNVGIVVNGANGLPTVTGYGPNGNAAMFINNGLIGSHVYPESSTQNFDTVNQAKLDATWTEDKIRLKAGVQYTNDHQALRVFDSFANNDWQAYGGYGPASNNPGGIALPQSWFTGSFKTANFINGWSGALPPQILKFNALQVVHYLESLGNPQTTNIPGWDGDTRFAGMYQMAENNGSHADLIENTFAGYLTANAQTEIGGHALQINLGLREEMTRLKSFGISSPPTSLTVQSSDHTAFLVGYTPNPVIVETGNNYMYLLPNLDLNFAATDDIAIRFDASRTLTRPQLNYLSPVLNVGQGQRVGALNATGGNPTLSPYTSDNMDLSTEWYYQPNSYVSIDGFVKNVSNFIVGGTNRQSINGVVDPTTGAAGQFTVSTQLNGPAAKVYGGEFAVQHVFGDSGWGLQANATVVGTNKPYDASNTSITGFAVTGLADSANLVGFFDKYGFQSRVALNWRAEYLDHFGQGQNNSKYGAEPTFVNSTTQVDYTSSYDITPQLSVFFEALNLNDATYSTHGRYSNQILDVVDYGRRFTLGFHAKL